LHRALERLRRQLDRDQPDSASKAAADGVRVSARPPV
jgi:hypothetical protein